MAKKSVILLSGGLDSTANLALADASSEHDVVLAIMIRYGQRAESRELAAARKFTEYYDVPLEVVDLPFLGKLGGSALTDLKFSVPTPRSEELDDETVTKSTASQVWVPNRNGVFIQVAAAYAESLGAHWVGVGFNREEAATFPDNSREFVERSNAALKYSTREGVVQVGSFTVHWDKREIVEKLMGLDRKFPFEWVWSCYEANEQACGECESCRRLNRALSGASEWKN